MTPLYPLKLCLWVHITEIRQEESISQIPFDIYKSDGFLCSFGFGQKVDNCEFQFNPSHALAPISMFTKSEDPDGP